MEIESEDKAERYSKSELIEKLREYVGLLPSDLEDIAFEAVDALKSETQRIHCNKCKHYQGVHDVQGHAPCDHWKYESVLWNEYCSNAEPYDEHQWEEISVRIKDLPEGSRLIQLAEEAAELSQATLKLVRAINGETPVTEEEAREHLLEEAADVQACMRCIFTDADDAVIRDIMLEKLRRWESRINGEG